MRTIAGRPMLFLYSAVLAIALVLTLPYWVFQMLRRGKYRAGLRERLGHVPARLADSTKPAIWIHAVSVGEVLAVTGVIRRLRDHYSNHRVVISTTTAAGQKLARERFGEDNVFFFPLDFSFAMRPYFDALRPALIVIAETELWPNFFRLARSRTAKLCVINARISDRSFPRYRLVARWLGPVLDNVDLFLAQTRADAVRLISIGAAQERVEDVGNLKFDIPAGSTSALVNHLRVATTTPRIVCGSTVDGEEPLVIEAMRAVWRRSPSALLILAPRHPERFDSVAALLESSGLPFVRRSRWKDTKVPAGGVFLLDTIGELADLYQIADVAFVGGSLVPRGGHNILEAARFGIPTIVGPYMENFREMMTTFYLANALCISDAAHLGETIEKLLADPAAARAIGSRAQETWRSNTGATHRTLERIAGLLSAGASVIPLRRQENA